MRATHSSVHSRADSVFVVPAHSASKPRVNALVPGPHHAPHTALWNMGPLLRGDDSRSVRRAYRLRQPLENLRQIGLDRARVDVEHAIAPLAQPRPPLGTRLGRGRAF